MAERPTVNRQVAGSSPAVGAIIKTPTSMRWGSCYTQNMASLSIENLTVKYGDHPVIQNLSFNIEPGEIIALTGTNGSGKTTVLKALAGFHPMEYSRFQINGQPTTPQSDLHQQRTYAILDNFSWVRGLTLWDHFLLIGQHLKVEELEEIMHRFEITAFANRIPHSLSTGQLQRASLATLAMRDWDILFLDEPEQRLDTQSQTLIAEILATEIKDRCVLMATHSTSLLVASQALELNLG